MLTLKDLNSVEFDSPCPHLHHPNNLLVVEALELMFARSLMQHGSMMHNSHGVLSILLAGMVHHSGWMLHVLEIDPSHPFKKLPILSSPSYRA